MVRRGHWGRTKTGESFIILRLNIGVGQIGSSFESPVPPGFPAAPIAQQHSGGVTERRALFRVYSLAHQRAKMEVLVKGTWHQPSATRLPTWFCSCGVFSFSSTAFEFRQKQRINGKNILVYRLHVAALFGITERLRHTRNSGVSCGLRAKQEGLCALS
jgi:hypothetical protein